MVGLVRNYLILRKREATYAFRVEHLTYLPAIGNSRQEGVVRRDDYVHLRCTFPCRGGRARFRGTMYEQYKWATERRCRDKLARMRVVHIVVSSLTPYVSSPAFASSLYFYVCRRRRRKTRGITGSTISSSSISRSATSGSTRKQTRGVRNN